MMKVGNGIFIWVSLERRSNRYGSFFMSAKNYDETAETETSLDVSAFEGKKVLITCVVTEARDSGHIGDFFLGVYPSRPNVGDRIELGVGTLQSEDLDFENPGGSKQCVFLVPNDGRAELWIDPRILYRLHDQTVDVFVEETDRDFSPAPVINDDEEDEENA